MKILQTIQSKNNKLQDVEACPICKGNTFIVVANKPYRIVQCKNCSFSYQSPKPNKDRLQEYYSLGQTSTHTTDHILRQYQSTQRMKWLARTLDFNKIHSVLDIGCDDGLFLRTVKHKYPNVEAFGIEPSVERSELTKDFLPQQNVQTGFFEDIEIDMTFDLITGFHVLEHTYDLTKFLNKIKSIMRQDSFLCLEVPSVSLSRLDLPLGVRILSPGYIKSPEHLSFFTAKTFRRLLQSHGFSITNLKGISFGLHPKINSFVINIPQLFPLYESLSKAMLLPFNVLGIGLQVCAIVKRNIEYGDTNS